MLYDLIIIGAGPAGLSAAIYAVRKKINTLVLTGNTASQTSEAHRIENYLGILAISGTELIAKFRDHAKKLNIEIKDAIEIIMIEPRGKEFRIIANNGDFSAKTIIIATGKKYRELETPGADKFKNKGITYCATCDAPLFKNKVVAVIGAGDAGQDAARQLTYYAAKIYLLNKYSELRGNNLQIQAELKTCSKIEILNNSEPTEVKGDRFVKNLVYNANGQIKELAVDGIFVEIGSGPASKFLNGVIKLNGRNEVIIDPKTNMTSIPGIFAAGDVTDVPHKQMIIAAGEGAKAALSAYEYLKSQRI